MSRKMSVTKIILIGNRDVKSSRREGTIFPLRVARKHNTVSVVISSSDAKVIDLAQQKGKQII
eukprot:15367196-Ditylum_brightwellii.AAC.1